MGGQYWTVGERESQGDKWYGAKKKNERKEKREKEGDWIKGEICCCC